MTEELYPINYDGEYHSLRIIPDDMTIYSSSSPGVLNGITTWKDWFLIPTSRPVINPPPFKANFVSIPGGNGSIDASTLLTPYPTYDDRSGSIDFIATRDYGSPTGWIRTYELIQNFLHGKLFKVILSDDPNFYYRGRMTVNSWKSDKDWNTITLDYRFEPFKIWLESDPTCETYYSKKLVIGNGYGANAKHVDLAFDMNDILNQGLPRYGYIGNVPWSMPVSPEIIVEPIDYYTNVRQYVTNPTAHSSLSYAITDVKPGETYTITTTVQAQYSRAYAFLDENYNVIEASEKPTNQPTPYSGTPTVPDGAKYLVVEALMDYPKSIVINNPSGTHYPPTFHGEQFIPFDLKVPNEQTPVCLCITHGPYKTDSQGNVTFSKRAEWSYRYTDINVHSHKAYNILLNSDKTMVRMYADEGARFKVSFKFKWGLL